MIDQKPDGFVKLFRSIEECTAFRSVPEMMAFAWMVMRAAWRPKTVRYKERQIKLQRGELALSTRDFARSWEWSEAKVRRYLNRLSTDAMIDARTDAGVNIITICKYNEYQNSPNTGDAPTDAPFDAGPTQDRRRTDAQNKEGKNIYIPSSVSNTESYPDRPSTTQQGRFAFCGKVIRLTESDFQAWAVNFANIPDLKAELQARDDYLSQQPEPDRRRWFMSTSSYLRNRNDQYAERNTQQQAAGGGFAC